MFLAGVAHLVERHLAKVEVASSSLVTRSIKEADANASASFLFKKPKAGSGKMEKTSSILENICYTI